MCGSARRASPRHAAPGRDSSVEAACGGRAILLRRRQGGTRTDRSRRDAGTDRPRRRAGACRLRRSAVARGGAAGAVRLLVSDELLIAGRAGPRRGVTGKATGPVRPMVGDEAGKWAARPLGQAEGEHDQRCDRSPDDHATLSLRGAPTRETGTISRIAAPSTRQTIEDETGSWRDCGLARSSVLAARTRPPHATILL